MTETKTVQAGERTQVYIQSKSRGRRDLGRELRDRINHAVPYNTTFLFLEEGCESVGQETPLAKAIEAAMKRKFEIWAASWITPIADELRQAEGR